MTTTRGLIAQSLRAIGVLAAGEEPTATQEQSALEIANQLLDSLSSRSLFIEGRTTETFTTAGGQTFTIGPGGNLNTTTPKIIDSIWSYASGEKPQQIHSVGSVGLLDRSSVGVVTDIPGFYNYEPGTPLGTLRFSDAITAGVSIKIVSIKPLTALPALQDSLEVQPGMERFLRLALALELADDYGMPPSQLMVDRYNDAMKAIKTKNAVERSDEAQFDPGLLF